MAMKEFETAARASSRELGEDSIPFKIKRVDEDGTVIQVRELTAHLPDENQIILLTSGLGRGGTQSQRVATVMNFFYNVLDKADGDYIEARLWDADDEFGLAQVVSIAEWLIEEWSGDPSQEPSGSQSSQSTTGASSTPKQALSI